MATSINPYQKFLGDKLPLDVLRQTSIEIGDLLARLAAEKLKAPIAPGKWSPHHILAHMADVELVFQARIRWILFEPDPALPGFNQDTWTAGWEKEQEPFAETLQRFTILRKSTIRLVESASPQDLQRTGHHADWGHITAAEIAAFLAGHDGNHMAQLRLL